ncbi:MAG: hypothetical protein OQK82_07970 [Candidatus Pacearchaeota archaeon]|nr:hypothetical protein [Candidatus Pacearchaeota archaeon]
MFNSEEVRDFNIYKGDVEYCVCRLEESVSYLDDKKLNRTKNICVFYYFHDNALQIVIEINDDIAKYTDFYSQFDNVDEEDPIVKHPNGKSYLMTTEPENLNNNPISRIGYHLDDTTNGRTYVSSYDEATELLKILINDGSVFDVSKALHGFPKMITYYTPCKFADVNSHARCVGGIMQPTKKKCPVCLGTGKQVHISAQDVIEIALPTEDQPSVVSPKDLMHYAENPFQFMDMQKKLVDEAEEKVERSVFGVSITHTPNGATTATEVINHYDTAQNTLFKFTKSPSKIYLFTIRTIADYLGLDEGLTTSILYVNKFNLESEEYLLDLLKKATDAQAPPEVFESLFKRLAMQQNRSGDSTSSVYETMRKFMPFGGLDKELKNIVVSSLPFSDVQRALLLNFKEITEMIISEHKTFLMDDYTKQKEIVDKIAQSFAEKAISSNSVKGIAAQTIKDESIN